MIINEFDCPLTAEDARKIAINNRDDSEERQQFRSIMMVIRDAASKGYTRHITWPKPRGWDLPNEKVQDALRSFGYRVVEKRAYEWDDKKKAYSDRPMLSYDKREQFFLEITWG